MTMLPIFSNGQNDTLSIVPTENIIRANQTYISLSHKVEILEGIVKVTAKENERLTLAYNHRTLENHELSNAINTYGYKTKALEGIIKQQKTIIKVIGGVAITAIGYGIYKTFKRQNETLYFGDGYSRVYPDTYRVGYILP